MSNQSILIVTPHSDFGYLVSQSLGKEPSLDVEVALSVSEAFLLIKQSKCFHYALLDMEMGVGTVLEQGFLLRNWFPHVALILISKKSPPPEMEILRPWKFLQKPFIQRDLIGLFHEEKNTIMEDSEFIDLNFHDRMEDTAPTWIKDEVRATQTLVEAISNLDVQEAILFSNSDILAHSGSLPPDAIEECSGLVRKYFIENGTAELFKPVHLKTTKKKHLLHATILAMGIILALAYDSETPFDIIRSQTRYLTSVLANPKLSPPEVKILPKTTETHMEELWENLASQDIKTHIVDTSKLAVRNSSLEQPNWRIKEYPEGTAFQKDRVYPDSHKVPGFDENKTLQSDCTVKESPVEQETPIAWTGIPHLQTDNQYMQTSFWIQDAQQVESHSTMQAKVDSKRCSLRPITPSLFDVYYACLLVPRIKTHLLEGDPANYLREELPKIFLAYGWRLEELQIDHLFLQWLVRIPPIIAPASHIKIIRQQSSQMILTNFARFNRNQFLRDFWSPGYLLGCGRQLLPSDAILEYIKMNREQYYPTLSLNWEPKREKLDS